ncbi:hypothetical protein [uncultured Roseibium sp.]|uniref:hypothetical protein n=1 Tax=uncultured Roseibium sp. TaxID=1936171 RepID=UPI002623C8D4|nr:hypothetical protein [uncultured Roseibium sp.]
MGIHEYIASIGLILWIGGMIIILILIYSQDKLLAKWKAKENKWVTRGIKGFGVRLIRENNPPKEFEKEFSNRVFKKYVWIGYLSLFGFAVMVVFGV